MTFRRIVLAVFFLASAVRAADPPTPPAGQKPQGAGGDGGTKPKVATMIIESEESGDEAAPPIPQGDERRAIGDYIRDNSGDVRDCYARRLQERPTLQGKLIARFDIGPNGKVIGASAEGIADRELVLCVVQVVRKWEFEKPAAGGKLRVAYPFKFEPQPTR
jgi:outer membrane biosynthesis protein TonB